jgi:hypothetical protein
MDDLEELISDNANAREQLRNLVEGLRDKELDTAMPAGWTVSALLAHLAFWDQRAVTLIGKWKKEGVGPSPIDTDVINEVTRRLCLAIPPCDAAELALALAFEVDQLIANLTPAELHDIQTRGTTVNLRRGKHRRTHIAEIEQALQRR